MSACVDCAGRNESIGFFGIKNPLLIEHFSYAEPIYVPTGLSPNYLKQTNRGVTTGWDI